MNLLEVNKFETSSTDKINELFYSTIENYGFPSIIIGSSIALSGISILLIYFTMKI